MYRAHDRAYGENRIMFPSQHIACPECGVSVEICMQHEHECDRERYVEFQVGLHRAELDRFEADFGGYLDTPHGRFESWLAARERRRAEPMD
jgi:ssDNA-binding Zn-finger/Zn-ribbon topoisomerase 1